MKVLLVITVLIITFKIFEFIEDRQTRKNTEKKELFKKQITDFSLKFVQPFIKDNEKYEIFKLLNIDTIKIYVKLLQENFDNNYIDEDINALYINEEYMNIRNNIGNSIEAKKFALEEIKKLESKRKIFEKKWNFKDSYDFLNELYFNCLFEKFIKTFAKDNENCVDDWNSIKDCYIKTFANNMNYLIFIQKYLIKKAIVTSFDKNIENIEKDVVMSIEKKAFDEKVNDFKNLMASGNKVNKEYINIEQIDVMSGIEFENFLKNLFEQLNYKVITTKTTGDQGADLIIEKFSKKIIVQAKRYSNSVSNKAIQEAVAAIKFYDAQNAIVITNNYFTKSANELAKSNNVELWDREVLIKHLKLVNLELL